MGGEGRGEVGHGKKGPQCRESGDKISKDHSVLPGAVENVTPLAASPTAQKHFAHH